MTEITAGQYAVVVAGYNGILSPEIRHITKVTDKMVFFTRYGTRQGQTPKSDVLAYFDSEDEAQKLVNRLAGIKGEQDRRIIAARQAASEAAHAAIASARQETRHGA